MPYRRMNRWRFDPHGWGGAAVMFGFGMLAFSRWHSSGNLFFALTCLRDFAASWFLVTRYSSRSSKATRTDEALSYVSSAMPFAYLSAVHGISSSAIITANLFAIVGFALSTVALFELGKSFGVAPASRKLVRTGVYGAFRHPMYLGYGFSEIGQAVLNPLNVFVLVVSLAFYAYRARREERVLAAAIP